MIELSVDPTRNYLENGRFAADLRSLQTQLQTRTPQVQVVRSLSNHPERWEDLLTCEDFDEEA